MILLSEKLGEKNEDVFDFLPFSNSLRVGIGTNWSKENYRYLVVLKYISDDVNITEYNYCRISMIEPVYLNEPGENLKLSKEDINIIMNILNKNVNTDSVINYWQYLINCMNNEHDILNEKYYVPADINLPIPNYYELL